MLIIDLETRASHITDIHTYLLTYFFLTYIMPYYTTASWGFADGTLFILSSSLFTLNSLLLPDDDDDDLFAPCVYQLRRFHPIPHST